jgi:hypothetical protein
VRGVYHRRSFLPWRWPLQILNPRNRRVARIISCGTRWLAAQSRMHRSRCRPLARSGCMVSNVFCQFLWAERILLVYRPRHSELTPTGTARGIVGGEGRFWANCRQAGSKGANRVSWNYFRIAVTRQDEQPFSSGIYLFLVRRPRRISVGGALMFRTASATISPITGPCLKPLPDPPPTIQTFSAWGWRSRMKLWSVEFSY